MYIYGIKWRGDSQIRYIGQRSIWNGKPEDDPYMGSGKDLGKIYKIHGIHCFEKVILARDIKSQKKLNKLEIKFIKKYNTFENGWNLSEGGDGSGPKSLETRKKISAANKGKKFSDETKKKMSAAKSEENHPMFGKKHSPEAKAKISASRKGKKCSDEHRAKITASRKGKKFSDELRANMSASQRKRRIKEKLSDDLS